MRFRRSSRSRTTSTGCAARGTVRLAGLEHMDERYLRAVGYTTKSKRGSLPKMALFGDIVGDDEAAVAAATSDVVRIANARSGEGFIAVSAEARRKFWLDRARTAAIARHTNAFKINEDVVMPLARMGEYTDEIERINIELSIANKLALIGELERVFAAPLPLARAEDTELGNLPDAEVIGERDRAGAAAARGGAGALGVARHAIWMPGSTRRCRSCSALGHEALHPQSCAGGSRARRRCVCSTSCRTARSASHGSASCATPLQQIFGGRVFAPILAACEDAHRRVLRGRVFVALHMHAGDGNVHTNIPVNSDDYEMLRTATAAVARIMGIARRLDGVISGEHGIGITKLEFLSEAEIADFRAYKQRGRPAAAASTAASSCRAAISSNAYTPSFNLLGHESLIMQQSDIGTISDSIKDCLRCGKCKPVCATHVPRANLLYSPRNKILATSLLIEAFLYEEQTRRGVSIRHWDEFADVGDHCTVCHKCASPCPVDIDFGDVSMAMRDLLRRMGKKRFNPGTAASMFFLNATQPRDHPSDAQADDRMGLQGAAGGAPGAARAWRGRRRAGRRPPRASPPMREQVVHFVNKRMPGGSAEEDRARAARHRESGLRADHPQSRGDQQRHRGGVLLSRAAARSGSSHRWGSPPRRCCGTSGCRPCCRRDISAAAIRSAARASSTARTRSPRTIAFSSTASPTP